MLWTCWSVGTSTLPTWSSPRCSHSCRRPSLRPAASSPRVDGLPSRFFPSLPSGNPMVIAYIDTAPRLASETAGESQLPPKEGRLDQSSADHAAILGIGDVPPGKAPTCARILL